MINPLWILAGLGAVGAYAYTKHLGPFALAQQAGATPPALGMGNPVSKAIANSASAAATQQLGAPSGQVAPGLATAILGTGTAACLAALQTQTNNQGLLNNMQVAAQNHDPITQVAGKVYGLLLIAQQDVHNGLSCAAAMQKVIGAAQASVASANAQGDGETAEQYGNVVSELQRIAGLLPAG